MVQAPKRNLSISVGSSSAEASTLAEASTATNKKKSVKSSRRDQPKCFTVPTPTVPVVEPADQAEGRKPWGRSRSFDEPTERIPIALPVELTQALRLKAVIVKKTPSQIIAELLRAHL